MKKILYSIIITLLLTISLNALPSVAICGWDGVVGDEITFVLLRDHTAGEVIYFTEEDYSDFANAFGTGEGHLAYTVPTGGLLNNEVIGITESSPNTYTVNCAGGTAVHVAGTGNWSFGLSDEIYAYSASSTSSPWNTITEIHCFSWSSNVVPPPDQQISGDWPNGITIAFNIGGPAGTNADFMDAFRVNTTLSMLQDGSNWNLSTGDLSLSCTDFINNMLPIELISFDSRLRGNEVLLNWSTASEVNNDRFEIEHSRDGKNFAQIGTIDGSGTSNRTNFYKMVHSTPSFGMNYYRLKQVDYDGAFSYSNIVAENFHSNSTSSSVYPNPFDQAVTLQFPSSEYNSVGKVRTIEVYDIYGKLAFRTDVPIDDTNVTLDLSKLNSGAYFVQTLDGKSSLTKVQRIIKI